MNLKKAVILSSGGIDSTTVMAIAKDMEFSLYSLTFNYGQRHQYELQAAKKVAEYFRVKKHLVVDINLRTFGGSALTDHIDVPKSGIDKNNIPVTYVPARNTIFLSYALAWAEVIKSTDIFIGVNAVDYSGYPDCRPEFIASFEKMANLATKNVLDDSIHVKIRAPLIHLSKKEIIQKGRALGVDYRMTHSCYDPDPHGLACGRCDSCVLRYQGFKQANITDPTQYS